MTGVMIPHLLAFDAFDRLVCWHGLSGLALRSCVAATAAIVLDESRGAVLRRVGG
jgi:hypothetical protein